MWSESMLKYNALNQKYLELQQQRKDIIWQICRFFCISNKRYQIPRKTHV